MAEVHYFTEYEDYTPYIMNIIWHVKKNVILC